MVAVMLAMKQLLAFVARPAQGPSRTPAGVKMSVPLDDLDFESAKEGDLRELSSFFVQSFWLASTTFSGIELSASEGDRLWRDAGVEHPCGAPLWRTPVYDHL